MSVSATDAEDGAHEREDAGRGAGLAGVVVAGAIVGLGLLAPAGAAAPPLPPVSPEDLVASVITAKPGPLQRDRHRRQRARPARDPAGAAAGERVVDGAGVVDGDGKGRVALPSSDGERTLVYDGTTRWSYDSTDRTVDEGPRASRDPAVTARPSRRDRPADRPGGRGHRDDRRPCRTSTVTVDGTAEVAGRPAYQLVLTPLPTERTLLREVRVAVDAEKRIPLQLTVLAPARRSRRCTVGFSDITFGPQDPSLFTFTPPPGHDGQGRPARAG